LLDGTYQFSPQQEIRFETDTIELWASLDALVLKAVTLVLTRHLKPHISNQCVHVKGNGGGKKAVRQITRQLKDNSFVFRSDVKSYYARWEISVKIVFGKNLLTTKKRKNGLRPKVSLSGFIEKNISRFSQSQLPVQQIRKRNAIRMGTP
jgi:hypothetical protein